MSNSSFWNIKFYYFYGENIKLIHNNAFGNTSKTIKKISIYSMYVNHSPLEYDVWKVLNNSLVNVKEIDLRLDVTEMPTQTFISWNFFKKI